MLHTEERLIDHIIDGKLTPVLIRQPIFDRRSNEPIVTEDRKPEPYRALPRAARQRVLEYAQTQRWHPEYQRYDNGLLVGLQCWKCARPLVGWAPALRRPAGWHPGDNDELILVNGQPAVRLTCFNHYREGFYRSRQPNGVNLDFSYLHCADCVITDADGPDLLACFLAGHDQTRTILRLYQDDFWAQWMWRYSAVELVGRVGESLGPHDLMRKG